MLAMICRADDGGLGIQTWEIARHVRPDRILIIEVGDGRGRFTPERFTDLCADVRVVPNPPEPSHMRWLCDGADRVFTVEGCYQERLLSIARQAGTELCILANPELYPAHYRVLADRGVVRVFAPTEWERDRLGKHELLQMPVATDRVSMTAPAQEARRFLHVSAPAMLDRNGTDVVRAAIDAYHGPAIELLVSGPERPTERVQRGAVSVVPVEHVDDYWRLYDGVDVLVLPRRYGGLSLVAQEALACAIPTIMLDRFPESSWGGVHTTEAVGCTPQHMKGGEFDVSDGSPLRVAHAMAEAADGALEHLRSTALMHARSISWETRLPEWKQALC